MAYGAPVYAPPGTPFGPPSPFGNSPFSFPSLGLPGIGAPISQTPWGGTSVLSLPKSFYETPNTDPYGRLRDLGAPAGTPAVPNMIDWLKTTPYPPELPPSTGTQKRGAAPATRIWGDPLSLIPKAPKVVVTKKGKKKAAAPAYDPYGSYEKLLNNPPPAYSYTPSSSAFPDAIPLSNKQIEKYIAAATKAGDQQIANATSYYNDVRKRVEHSPDMTAEAKATAKAWIDGEIRTINRMQDRAIAAGGRNAKEILAATGAAAKLQQSFAAGMGKNYTDAAAVLNTLGQGVGAGVSATGENALSRLGTIAPGAMPSNVTGLPGQAGQAVTTLGGAVPAQNLALQAAGAGPGYVTGGAQNIANQMAGLIQGSGGNLAVGAQRAGEQQAAALNDKIFEAQQQYGPLFHQIFGDLTSHQDSVNSQLMTLAQGGLTNAYQQAGRFTSQAEGVAARYAANVAQLNANNLARVAHNDQTDARNQAAAIQASNQNWQRWSTTLSASLALTKARQDYEIAKLKAQNGTGPKAMSEKDYTAYTTKYMNAFRLFSGQAGFTTNNVAGNWGTPSTQGQSKGVMKLQNAPVTIDVAIQRMVDQFGSIIARDKSTRDSFMSAIKAAYGVPGWTDAEALKGIGPIPTSDGSPPLWRGRLPINPLYTKNGEIVTLYKGKEEEHDPLEWDSKYWQDYFKKNEYKYIGPAQAKASGGGDGFSVGGLLSGAGAAGLLLGNGLFDLIGSGNNWKPNPQPQPAFGTPNG